MTILTQNKKSCVSAVYLENVYIGGDGLSIKANFASGRGMELARYRDKNLAIYALDAYFVAVISEEASFEFPGDRELIEAMSVQKSHSSHVSSMKVSHGGS